MSDIVSRSGCYIKRNGVQELDKLLHDLTMDEKAEIILKTDKHIIWKKAGESGSSKLLEYLLDECGLDVDAPNDTPDRPNVEYLGTKYEIGRTPLLRAIWSELFNYEKVKILVKHGARVNSIIDTFGENVNPSLIHACRQVLCTNVELVQFLIDNGADVNLRNHEGLTAIHYAARNGKDGYIKVLLENGAVYCWNNCVNVLPYAAMFYREDTMKFLIKNTSQPDSVIADAYEVLGAINFLDGDPAGMQARNLTSSLWRKAMQIRYNNEENPCLKTLPNYIKDTFQKEREPQTKQELLDVLSHGGSTSQQDLHLGIQSFLIFERVIGEERAEYIELLDTHANWLGRNHNYTEIRLMFLKYALNLCQKHDIPGYTIKSLLDTMTSYYLVKYQRGEKTMDLLNALGDSLTTGTNLYTKLKHFNCEIMLNIIICLVALLKDNITWVYTPPAELKDSSTSSYESDNLETINHISNYMYDPDLTYNMEQFCTRMSKINPVDSDNRNLLHLGLDPRNYVKTGRTRWIPLPNLDLIKLLVQGGFDIDWRDCDGNTIMMKLIQDFETFKISGLMVAPEVKPYLDVITCVLDVGFHGDIRNKYGRTSMDMIRTKLKGNNHIKQLMDVLERIKMEDERISLQCLAARTLADSGVPYEDYAPVGIIAFIDMHNKYKSSGFNKK